ncbi:hypothetical protein L195_g026856 [Trifolium pratense]|uniref:Uncharacterized protein n=1 Tax=Trifolium pratense TaxID=57577 RepID=A0A2K3NKG3_TRIPR|nr:hypothetical protein L195_g026856 [Trifolium pratense]
MIGPVRSFADELCAALLNHLVFLVVFHNVLARRVWVGSGFVSVCPNLSSGWTRDPE